MTAEDFSWVPRDPGEQVYESLLSGTSGGPGWGEISEGVAYIVESDGGVVATRSSVHDDDLRAWVEGHFA